jgi:hypothetical protein
MHKIVSTRLSTFFEMAQHVNMWTKEGMEVEGEYLNFSFMYDIIKPIMRMKSIANFNFYACCHDDALCAACMKSYQIFNL